MERKIQLHTPLDEAAIKELKLRDIVYLSGELYTMRDKAHQRILDYLRAGKPIPIERGAVIYPLRSVGAQSRGDSGGTHNQCENGASHARTDRST